jgi:hypothetical protein
MNSSGDGKPESGDPEHLLRTLDLELTRQRTTRQQAGSPYRTLRVASFIFIFAVIVGAFLAFYYVFYLGGLDEFRARKEGEPTATPSLRSP